MDAHGFIIPHDSKQDTGSEDGYLIAQDSDEFFLCVADGVGGWKEQGVNVRQFTNSFLNQCADGFLQGHKNPEIIVEYGLNHTMQAGSVTLACAYIKDNEMRGYQMGDSGFLIIRNSQIFLETDEQQHSFNHPYKIGRTVSGSFHGDNPQDGLFYRIPLISGDIIVFGTDGLFDNLTSEEILSLVLSDANAQAIAQAAYQVSKNETVMVPFYERAYLEGATERKIRGGKQDDIGVILARC